jgi:hypothetical protein
MTTLRERATNAYEEMHTGFTQEEAMECIGIIERHLREAVEEKLKQICARRNGCHGTYNGGYTHGDEDAEEHDAFHHGMDTVFNVIENELTTVVTEPCPISIPPSTTPQPPTAADALNAVIEIAQAIRSAPFDYARLGNVVSGCIQILQGIRTTDAAKAIIGDEPKISSKTAEAK